jgi:hypothetical protein
MKRIKSVTIGGKRHRIHWKSLAAENAVGFAYTEQALIEIDPGWDELCTADALVHELIHKHPATCHLEETAVEELATDIITMLHKAHLIAEDEDDAKA